MTRLMRYAGLMVLLGAVSALGFAQSSSESAAGQTGASGSPSPAATGAQDPSVVGTGDAKKKKVWTNEDVSTLSGPVSVVGSSKKKSAAGGSGEAADPQYIANAKKQLEKLQSQLDDTNRQLTAYKDFEQGKAPEPAGYPVGKGYNRVPVDQQIGSLEQKKKDLEQKISDLLDEARKKGVLPGQLR